MLKQKTDQRLQNGVTLEGQEIAKCDQQIKDYGLQ